MVRLALPFPHPRWLTVAVDGQTVTYMSMRRTRFPFDVLRPIRHLSVHTLTRARGVSNGGRSCAYPRMGAETAHWIWRGRGRGYGLERPGGQGRRVERVLG